MTDLAATAMAPVDFGAPLGNDEHPGKTTAGSRIVAMSSSAIFDRSTKRTGWLLLQDLDFRSALLNSGMDAKSQPFFSVDRSNIAEEHSLLRF